MSYEDLMEVDPSSQQQEQEEEESPWLEEEEVYHSHHSHSQAKISQISQQEWTKLSQVYSDAGYREGITSGKASHLQQGFDEGYLISIPFARDLGNLRGITTSLLTLLTTKATSKHLIPFLNLLEGEGGKEFWIKECRELINDLNLLGEIDLLPIDEEAELHSKVHEEEGMSLEMIERREMRKLEESFSNIGGAGGKTNLVREKEKKKKVGLEECRERLKRVLKVLGLEGMLSREI